MRVSPDGLAWTTVATQTGYVAAAGTPLIVDFAATPLRYVELHATRLAAASAGVFYLAVAEIETYTASAPAGSVVASWTSPTDDGPSGGAASYDLRAVACPLDLTTAPSLTAPTPSPAVVARARASVAVAERPDLLRDPQHRRRRQRQRLVEHRQHQRAVTPAAPTGSARAPGPTPRRARRTEANTSASANDTDTH